MGWVWGRLLFIGDDTSWEVPSILGRGLNILKCFGSGDERTGGEGGQGRPNLAGGPGISVKLPSFYDFLVWWGFLTGQQGATLPNLNKLPSGVYREFMGREEARKRICCGGCYFI